MDMTPRTRSRRRSRRRHECSLGTFLPHNCSFLFSSCSPCLDIPVLLDPVSFCQGSRSYPPFQPCLRNNKPTRIALVIDCPCLPGYSQFRHEISCQTRTLIQTTINKTIIKGNQVVSRVSSTCSKHYNPYHSTISMRNLSTKKKKNRYADDGFTLCSHGDRERYRR